MTRDKADQFRNYEEHTGGPPPYRPDDKVDVQFADGRVELDAKASYWANRGGLEHGMWDHRYPNYSHHIVRSRLRLRATPNGAGAESGQTDEHCRHGNGWQDHCDGCGRVVGSFGMPGA